MSYQGRKVFQAGEVLAASDMNSTVDQTVMVFDDSTARDTAIPSPTEGMIVYLKDTNAVLKYDDTDWVSVALDINLDANRAVVTNAGGDLVVSAVTVAELTTLSGITASTSELNILDGVTADATEINILDGAIVTTAELNALDGITADSTELNVLDGITVTTAELNFVDGVTSAIQTQLNTLDTGKQDDVLTTQGDIIVSDVSGNPQRLSLGPTDTVLTSNGTTATWSVGGGGGGGFESTFMLMGA